MWYKRSADSILRLSAQKETAREFIPPHPFSDIFQIGIAYTLVFLISSMPSLGIG